MPFFCLKGFIREPKPPKKGNKGTTGRPRFTQGAKAPQAGQNLHLELTPVAARSSCSVPVMVYVVAEI